MSSPPRRSKILFFAEGATLAHIGRPFVLAQGLDAEAFDVIFARPAAFSWLTRDAGFKLLDLDCQESKVFTQRLERGQPLYDFDALNRYVQADLALIDEFEPDVVIGDFRLSLSVSARLRQVPYIAICDAYWSPERPLQPMLPVMQFTPYVPLAVAERLFRAIVPIAFRLHARPMEALRKRYALPSLGHDLRLCYTDADLRLYANFSTLFPEVCRTVKADFLGPISWSPPDRSDLDFPQGDGPLVYVTMGSSGDPQVLATLIPLLEAAGVRTMVATAGKTLPPGIGSTRTRVHDFLPGDQLCRQAQLVVCNGGSPTTNQALIHGVPVLGIARNMDQFLNMQAIESFGAGRLDRADRANRTTLSATLHELLQDQRFTEKARALSGSTIAGHNLAHHINALRARKEQR